MTDREAVLVRSYVRLVQNGRRTEEEVPEQYREKVKEEIEKQKTKS